MPNFGVWEFIVILVTLLVGLGAPILIIAYALPAIVKEIRKIWRDSDPDA